MPRDKDDAIESLNKILPDLTSVQVDALTQMATAFAVPVDAFINPKSDFATQDFAELFGDVLRIHHVSSQESFTKDKFEHAFAEVLRRTGHTAELAARGNPGHDLTVDEELWSLKTQADANIKPDRIHISKFMELGKGRWDDEADLEGLRDAMFRHMESYDRIFTLRCLSAAKDRNQKDREYELVEIPKSLLLRAADFRCVMQQDSTQTPKPGRCEVLADDGTSTLVELYFDGGTERKLQVRKLSKDACIVHASWRFKS